MKACLKRRIIEALILFRHDEVSARFLAHRVNNGINDHPHLKGYARITIHEVSAVLKFLAAKHVIYRTRLRGSHHKPTLYRLHDHWHSIDAICDYMHIT